MARFENKRVLVTGAAGGIGQCVVELFRREGAAVAAADRDVSQLSADALLPGDLTDPDYSDTLPAEAAEHLGGLDILINNAGLMRRGPVTDTSDEDFKLSAAVNIEAPFRLSRAAVPIMSANGGGAIVNTSSCWGIHPGPDHAVYCMTKAAIASLTQCMGRDHAHQNIRVNAVCPNEVDTPMLRTGFELRGLNADTAISQLNQSVPLGRIANATDIADVIAFLASDEARYLCGSLVEVNGGKAVA
ncbi:short-chain dehydrogenase [Chromatiales bacterium (ex Bugula neritina AB1)]|nr:short-chain dehydrogenase [Chromatiales bacterium (ex Bugula neritina AB1)]